MTEQEVYKEVYTDLEHLQKSTLIRLTHEYDKDRRRHRIKPQEHYPKFYQVKTKKKNTWLIMYEKPHELTRYKENDSLCNPFTYYHTDRGLRVLKPKGVTEGYYEGMIAYNGHLFTRYDERLNLNLNDPLEKIKHFFAHNSSAIIRNLRQGERDKTVTIVKDGMLLGEERGLWHVQNTFISFNQLKADQEELKEELLESIRKDLGETWNADDFDRMLYTFLSGFAAHKNTK